MKRAILLLAALPAALAVAYLAGLDFSGSGEPGSQEQLATELTAATQEANTNKTESVKKIIKTSTCTNRDYKKYDGEILEVGFSELPYIDGVRVPRRRALHDDNNVSLHQYRGRLNYHPVLIAQDALSLLDAYNTTKTTKYLNSSKLTPGSLLSKVASNSTKTTNYLISAEALSDKLLDMSLPVRSSLFFPYTFNFPLHGYQEEAMLAPWYSGMAQGQILSLFVRLYIITKEDHYLDLSRKIVKSFDLVHSDNSDNAWVSCVDENGYLWLEEYPSNPASYTLNGMIFAIYGLYDYYRITKDTSSEDLLRGAIATIKENIYRFRTENGISHYCIRHPRVMSIGYHKIHIGQLKMLHEMTGDGSFLKAAIEFTNDTNEDEGEKVKNKSP
jgi:hypothetical protein